MYLQDRKLDSKKVLTNSGTSGKSGSMLYNYKQYFSFLSRRKDSFSQIISFLAFRLEAMKNKVMEERLGVQDCSCSFSMDDYKFRITVICKILISLRLTSCKVTNLPFHQICSRSCKTVECAFDILYSESKISGTAIPMNVG